MKHLTSKMIAVLLSVAMIAAFAQISLATDYTTDGATEFIFSDNSITVNEGNYSGYKISKTALTVNGSGVYILSGSCSDGSISVKKGVTDVTLILNGLELTSSDTAPIVCGKSSAVTIISADGTVNTLTDSAYNNDDNFPENENAESCVIKCKDGSKVTLCGGGTLNVNANGKNGIKSGATTEAEGEAQLVIKETTLNVNAPVNDAVKAEATLSILSGKLTISAGDDAIHSDLILNIGATDTDGPDINITACYEGIEAAQVNIYSGNIKLRAEDDCINAANADLTDYAFEINIFGGSFDMYTTSGDGLDSNGNINISGGTVSVWTANAADNQPLDADGTITISGGTVLAAGASAGMGMKLDAQQEYISFGSSITGGFGGFGGMGERPGFGFNDNMQPPSDNNTGNNPDIGNGFSQMQPNTKPDNMPNDQQEMMPNGQQGGFPWGNSSLNITSGSVLSIKDSDGSIVWQGTALCNTSFLLFSSPELSSDGTYTLYSGDTVIASTEMQDDNSSLKPTRAPSSSEAPDDSRQSNNIWQILFFALCAFVVGIVLTILIYGKIKKH